MNGPVSTGRSALTGSLLEWANAIFGVKVIPVPRELKEMLEE